MFQCADCHSPDGLLLLYFLGAMAFGALSPTIPALVQRTNSSNYIFASVLDDNTNSDHGFHCDDGFAFFFWGLGLLNIAPVLLIALVLSPALTLLMTKDDPQPVEKEEEGSAMSHKDKSSNQNKEKGERWLTLLAKAFMFTFIAIQVSFSEWIFLYAQQIFDVLAAVATTVTSAFWTSMVVPPGCNGALVHLQAPLDCAP